MSQLQDRIVQFRKMAGDDPESDIAVQATDIRIWSRRFTGNQYDFAA